MRAKNVAHARFQKVGYVMNSQYLARAGLIAAVYAAASIASLTIFQGLSWGPVQFRISECICVLALFFPEAPAGLAIGCFIANLVNIPLSGLGFLGLFDVFFGSAATLLAALMMRRFRNNTYIALLWPAIFNAIIVPLYLPLLCMGFGFYTIPFTQISIEGAYPLMYLFGFASIGLGELAVMYILGLPLAKALKHTRLAAQTQD